MTAYMGHEYEPRAGAGHEGFKTGQQNKNSLSYKSDEVKPITDEAAFLALDHEQYELLSRLNTPVALYSPDDNYWIKPFRGGKTVYLMPFDINTARTGLINEICRQLEGAGCKVKSIAIFKHGGKAYKDLREYLIAIGDDEAARLYLEGVLLGDEDTHPIAELGPYRYNNIADELEQASEQKAEVDFTPKEWPTLNKKALHGIAGKVVELATRHSEADPAAVLATFLVRIAAEIGTNPVIMVGDSKHYPRINAVIVGDSSKARKGTSAQPIEKVFQHKGVDYISARTSPGPLSSGEGLVYAVRDEVREWKLVDKKTNLMDWVTTDPGIEDKRLCVIDEEFGAALGCTKREGNTLSTIIRQAWDHGNIEPLTKNNRIKSTGAHICILTHITNAELQQKMHTTEALNGFGNRMLWVCARRQGFVARPRPMPSDEVEALHNQIIEVVRTAQSKDFSSIQFSANTWGLWEEEYSKLSEDHHGYAGAIVNRAEAQVIRLSLIYALLDEQNIVEPCHLKAALAFWDYCQDSALYIFGGQEGDAITDKIITALRERDHSATEINELFQRHVSAPRIRSAIQELSSRGKIISYKKPSGTGRPTTIYQWCEKSELSEKIIQRKRLNSLNSLNSQDDNYKTNISGDEVMI